MNKLTNPYVIALGQAQASQLISESAAENIRLWLERPLRAEDTRLIEQHIAEGQWSELERAFWTTIPFGTAGRRGRMYPIGSAAINQRTIGETVQALADYLVESGDRELERSAAIAYDCRHHSREFAELSAGILVAAGFTVFFSDGIRSTPQLALTVRNFECLCGIMITASHNPPTDNAIKVFWSNGGQLKPPHDERITQRIESIAEIRQTPFVEAVAAKNIVLCQEEMDSVYRQTALQQSFAGPRNIKILFSPLHGVGLTSVPPILELDGFADVEIYKPHATPDGDFPNVPKNIANPENSEVFDAIADYASSIQADVALASDPDADRIGCSAPLTLDDAQWRTLTGNQIGALLGDYILSQHQQVKSLTSDHYVVTTVVSSGMLASIAERYSVRCFGEVLTGFKWIGNQIDAAGAENFLFGFEEAHGYLAGSFIRDKDAGTAAMLLAQRAALAKTDGRTLHQDLDELFLRVGCFAELTVAKSMPGADGMRRMTEIMQQLRVAGPTELGSMTVTRVRDYLTGTDRLADGTVRSCDIPNGNLLVFYLKAPKFRVAVRPSGTEPKIKFYLFGYVAPDQITDLEQTKQELHERLLTVHDDLMKAAGLAVETA